MAAATALPRLTKDRLEPKAKNDLRLTYAGYDYVGSASKDAPQHTCQNTPQHMEAQKEKVEETAEAYYTHATAYQPKPPLASRSIHQKSSNEGIHKEQRQISKFLHVRAPINKTT